MQHQVVVREALGFPGRVEGILGDFLAVHVDVHMLALGRVVRPGVIRQPALDTAALIVVGAGAFAVKFRARLETVYVKLPHIVAYAVKILDQFLKFCHNPLSLSDTCLKCVPPESGAGGSNALC